MAEFTSTSYTPDRLIAGEFPRTTKEVTIASGADLVDGSVVGKITTGTVPTTGTAGTNTGNGTMGSVAAGGTALKEGTYTARCYKAAANAGDFAVIDPDGEVVGIATVAVAFTSTHLNFTIADGSTDFAVGDTFTVAVSGTGKYKLSAIAATDGSKNPVGILAQDAAAASADVNAQIYLTGEFNENELTFGTGHSAATVREALQKRGIILRDAVQA